MDLETFRITHSTLIEHYQYIEAHLEGIYAALSGKPFHEGLQDVEADSLYRLIKKLQVLERELDITIFTEDEYTQLAQVSKRRNFWCHSCYFTMDFERNDGKGPRNSTDIRTMIADLREAETLRNTLFDKKRAYLKTVTPPHP